MTKPMEQSKPTETLPLAYALALWLRDLGLDVAHIAAALDVGTEAVEPLLRIAELKRTRLAAQPMPVANESPGVALFIDLADGALIEDAASLAELRGSTFHLVALRRARRASHDDIVEAARAALRLKVDVNPIAATGRRADVIRALVADRGPVTVLSDARSTAPTRR